jgi:chromate transport protein ChrA
MRLPPFFWPLILLVLAAADCGMVSGHPPIGIFSLALPAVVAIAAAVALAFGQSGGEFSAAAAAALAVVAALAAFALGYVLPPSWLLVVLVALVLGSMAVSTIWLKSKGDAK